MTPQEITENGLQRILGGRIRTPAGAVYTCTAGQKRLLDFWLVSDKAELFTDNYRIVPGTPWKPHSTIAFDLVVNARLVMGMQLLPAARILSDANGTCRLNVISPATSEDWSKAEWTRQAGEWEYCRSSEADAIQSGTTFGEYTQEEHDLGICYAKWGAQASGSIAVHNGLPPKPAARSSMLVATRRQVYPPRKATKRPGETLPANTTALAWAGADHALRTLLHFHRSGRGGP